MNKYIRRCERLFREHKLPNKVRTLYAKARYPTPSGLKEKLEKLDKPREQFMKNAEKKCRKRRMGEVDFSPEVMTWKKQRDVWKAVIRWQKGAKLNRPIIKRRARVCGIQSPLSAVF